MRVTVWLVQKVNAIAWLHNGGGGGCSWHGCGMQKEDCICISESTVTIPPITGPAEGPTASPA